jgi:2,3-bisphosphoglycerate-dependent phosphoglycerate mutase
MNLILLRHGESIWNLENRFTGWTDVDLSETGRIEAYDAGAVLRDNGYDFDICYTSYLKRAILTLNLCLVEMDRAWLPVTKSWKLNERHYGALQGLNKADTAAKYGEEQVLLWRRSFSTRPPSLSRGDVRNPALLAQYRNVDKSELPLCESLKDTIERTLPYFEEEIKPRMLKGERVLIVAHGNSLRALVMYFEHLNEDEIMKVNLPTGIPLHYEFDEDFSVVHKEYIGDAEVIAAKIKAVSNQGKAMS